MQKGASYWMGLRYFDDEDPFFLAQVQRGITNFVKILTGKDIPVYYATQGDSMTDGETIYISSKLEENNIDYTVGLALHEASHILLTDFNYVNQNEGTVLKRVWGVPEEDIENVFLLVNFIEDRRIDNFVYTTAPGYQFYYEELYRKSFYNEIIDKNLQKDLFTTPTWESYFFRIINIFNRNSDLDKLPGLKEVFDLIDIKTINRLQSTRDSVEVAVGIYNIIKPYLVEEDSESEENNHGEGIVKDQVERQKNFINSKFRKRRINKSVQKEINNLIENDIQLKYSDINQKLSIPTIVCKDWNKVGWLKTPYTNSDYVDKGISLGKKLLSKLVVRNYTRKDIFEDKKKGKLNPRKLHTVPFNENLFYRIEKENYKDAFIHISLDLSGSMYGSKLEKTIQTAIAIAYASCFLKNLNVEISLRSTIEGNSPKNQGAPLLIYAFNSKKHSYKQLYKFRTITPMGLTPEGVCLDIVKKNLPKPTYNEDIYLLNISDGLPNISEKIKGYGLSAAVDHTSRVIKQYNKEGIKVLSYFIASDERNGLGSEETRQQFGKMYGKNAQYIDVSNMSLVANTINNLLLSNTIKVF